MLISISLSLPSTYKPRQKLGKVQFDDKNGIGNTPNHTDVLYKGFVAYMRPSLFLKLAAPIQGKPDADTVSFLKDTATSKGIASPSLTYDLDKNKIVGHDGRHRALAIEHLTSLVPVHIILHGEKRARHLTEAALRNFMEGSVLNEKGSSTSMDVKSVYHDAFGMLTPSN